MSAHRTLGPARPNDRIRLPAARRTPTALAVTTALVLAAFPAHAGPFAGGAPDERWTAASPVPIETVEQAAARVEMRPAAVAAPYPFATVDEVEFVTPSPRPLLVGFHEAAGHGTVALTPTAGEVLAPRGRGTAPTSAVDVALEPNDPVLAVVTGTVLDVSTYTLYGRLSDVLVTIVPDGRPDLRVRMLHIDDVRVSPGQHVTAGRDVVAGTARGLPVSSQIDRYTGRAAPHVHIEVTSG